MSRSTESRIRDIAIEDIDRSRNHRIAMPGDKERIEALKQSIEASGQLQPIRVYERGPGQKESKDVGKYILGFGARRCAAMELMGRKTVAAIVFEPATDAEIAQARAVENLHRQDITPLEEVQAVSDVLEAIKADPKFTGDPFDEAAARLARSVAWIKDRDYLHRLTKPVQRFAMRAGLPAGHLRELAKVGGPAEQMRLACLSVGAPSWCFPATDKQVSVADHQHDVQEGYFAELADGKVQRWPLTKLKIEVGKVQLSLRIIPWEFDKPVQHGDTKLRKCAGCPHNSETDRTLFGIEENADNPRGFCLNASCYKAKDTAAEAAKEQVLARVSKRAVQTAEVIRELAPEWLKESTVVGYIRRQLDKAGDNASKPKEKPAKEYRGLSLRKFTDHERKLVQFAADSERWQQRALASILKRINDEPVHRISWCVLLGVQAFWDHARIQHPNVPGYGEPCTAEPVIPSVAGQLEESVKLAFKATRNSWLELIGGHKQIDPSERKQFALPHPRLLELIAEALDLKLPTTPQWTPAVPETPAVAVAA